MNDILIYAAGNAPAVRCAAQALAQRGLAVTEQGCADANHLLLPAPSFDADGRIRGGGILEHILADLKENVTVIGGGLEHPALVGYRTMDLLRDGQYLARNAAITAECAIRVASQQLPTTVDGCPMLIVGWGRIGKCLAAKLKAAGAAVSVAARKKTDRDMLLALGYGAEDPQLLRHGLGKYRVIFNTVPAMVLRAEQMAFCSRGCIKIELASQPGMEGSDIISALGLPGKMVPEASGQLMARSIVRLLAEREAGK